MIAQKERRLRKIKNSYTKKRKKTVGSDKSNLLIINT